MPPSRARRGGGWWKALLGLVVLLGAFVVGVGYVTGQIGDGGFGQGVFGDVDDLFVDDDDSQFEAEIEVLANAGVTQGCGAPEAQTFCPDQPVTRGEFAVFLGRAVDIGAGPVDRFQDVAAEAPIADAVGGLAEAEVVAGCAQDRFCPGQVVTRAEAATFVARTVDVSGEEPQAFDDLPRDSPFFEPVGRLAAAGIVQACDVTGEQFCPQRPITRAEVARLLVEAGLVQ